MLFVTVICLQYFHNVENCLFSHSKMNYFLWLLETSFIPVFFFFFFKFLEIRFPKIQGYLFGYSGLIVVLISYLLFSVAFDLVQFLPLTKCYSLFLCNTILSCLYITICFLLVLASSYSTHYTSLLSFCLVSRLIS